MNSKLKSLNLKKNRVILSRKAVEAEENEKKKAELLQSIKAGDVIEGKVARLTNFGAFIDLGGVDGLVHVSELSHEHVKSPEEVVSIGDTVKVKVRSVEQDSERVSLSIKDTLPSPFETIQEKYSEGDIVEGKVMRLASFGAFVEIGIGLQGLVHISEISHKHIGTPGEVLEPGQTVQVKILGINPEEERISLSIKAANPDEETEEASEETTQHYTQPADENENNPTLGDVFGDKLKDLNL